jgi:N-acetyl-gamma-glutamyl-phosphate reductase
MVHKYSASIVGSRGYSGVELARLLLRHPHIEFSNAFATKPFRLSDDILDAKAASVKCMTDDQIFMHLTDFVFLATPAEVSLELAPKIVAQGKKVIDLSGAFRLKTSDTKKWYGFERSQQTAEYGLVPFAGPLKPETKLISNPGCYATAISLALIPLLKNNLIEIDSLVIDAKSGTTGAGRKAAENLLFSEVEGDCLPYRVGRHQHTPEIQEAVSAFAGADIDPHFVTHLLPVRRGITAGIYAKARTSDIGAIAAAFSSAYDNYPLLRHGADSVSLSKLQNVVGTPFTHISYTLNGNKLYLFSSIDNLLKGAASQAVENLNRWLDLPVAHTLVGEN